MRFEDQLSRTSSNLAGSAAAARSLHTFVHATALLALSFIPSLTSAAIYKCTAQDGSITYTDAPCPVDTTTQDFDPAVPSWLYESSQVLDTPAALPDPKSESQPASLATLCAEDEFRVWLKAQRNVLPERDVRSAKFSELNSLCRKALHLSVVAAPIPQTRIKRVLNQEMPRQ